MMGSSSVLIFLVLCIGSTLGDYKRVCYYSGWAVGRGAPYDLYPNDIDPTLCTHLNFAFATLNENVTNLQPDTKSDLNLYPSFTNLKSKNPNLKTLLSLGGWAMGSEKFAQLVSSTATMTQFADNAVKFLREHNFDGLDIDWEYPADRGSPPEDKQNFIELLRILRNAFDSDPQAGHHNMDRLLLMAAVGASEYRLEESYNVTGLVQYLDLINLMTYDFHGSWDDTINVHSALYSDTDFSVDRFTRYWLSAGVPNDKLIIGVPFYGRKFTLANVSDSDIGALNAGGGDMPYYEICRLIQTQAIKPVTLSRERVPYFVYNDQWVGYDDANSIKEKAQYIRANNLVGVSVWAIDLDDVAGTCGTGKFPLMHVLKEALRTSGSIVG